MRSKEYSGQGSSLGRIYSCTVGVVFFGTPHRGSFTATISQVVTNIANIFFKQSQDNLWIHQDQNALEHQSKSFAAISTTMTLVSIFEEQPTNYEGIVSTLFTVPAYVQLTLP